MISTVSRKHCMVRVKFGVRLGRVISAASKNGDEPCLTPYERVYWPVVKEVAQECERLGYDSIILPDHPMHGLQRYTCWSTLSALAACTQRVTLGTLTVNTMRYLPNPSLFAKEIATLDNICDGRLYPLGLGLGWTPEEYKAFGFPFPAHKTRLEQLQEAIEIMNLMFTQEKASYKGKHFNIDNLVCEPKPVQRPFPICVGGRGERTLRMATKYAHFIDVYGVDKKTLQERLDYIRKCCTEYRRDYETIVKSWGCWFWIYEDEDELNRYSAEFDRLTSLRGGQPTGIMKGTPKDIVESFKELVEMGISYFTLRFEDLPSKRGIRLFSEEVIRHLR